MDYPYQKLEVWQKAVDFSTDIMSVTAGKAAGAHPAVIQEIEKSSANIAAAIAEAKAYATKQDLIQHLYRAKGAVYKTVALLEILKRKKIMADHRCADLDESAQRIAAMLGGLIKSINNPNAGNGRQKRAPEDRRPSAPR